MNIILVFSGILILLHFTKYSLDRAVDYDRRISELLPFQREHWTNTRDWFYTDEFKRLAVLRFLWYSNILLFAIVYLVICLKIIAISYRKSVYLLY